MQMQKIVSEAQRKDLLDFASGREFQIELRMESDLGKLFIGGISWDTDEVRLRDYFSHFGVVLEAVIMKDRATGRARGFGFVVFSDPAVAERVVMDKHMIDGRMVEAKKAVPRDDQSILNRNSSSVHGSPSPARTKKIFVGGLPSTITDSDFKRYFLQFGPIADVVVMYDQSTQRPRGFGFITFESEDAVDKALLKTFHELNGKMVEVKRAVPKELSPGPTLRSPTMGYNYGMNRINSFLNGGYTQAFSPSSLGAHGMRMGARFSPLSTGRNGLPAIHPGYGMGMNFDPGFNSSFGGNSNYNDSVGYGRGSSPLYNGNSIRYGGPVGYGGGNVGIESGFGSTPRNVWGVGSFNYNMNSANSNAYATSGSGGLGAFTNGSLNWGGSPVSAQAGSNNAGYAGENFSFGRGETNFGLAGNGFGRSSGAGVSNMPLNAPSSGYEVNFTDLYGSRSVYGDPTWQSGSNDLDGSGPFGYGLGNAPSDITIKGSAGYLGGYNVNSGRQNRGIAT
ncbi:hypothetical protein J5N97_028673 [Dioscorea zingiberensis]|uniref:RRM domain-containing protein n=1 Tax=Dioscorea zingiberensis TaxID=325984 RepID=A0A9D5BZG1_9LILI|nr:hypothetical protein J5N97_028673 [Dioscorea zingiberensis]